MRYFIVTPVSAPDAKEKIMKKAALFIVIGLCFLVLPIRAQINLLHEFVTGVNDGGMPYDSLILSGTTLYGMTAEGGDRNKGTIFKIETNGTGFALLHEFAGGVEDGAGPKGDLILSGSTLYGMTSMGGDHNYGTIFKIETNGSGYTLMHEFAHGPTDGAYPNGSLIFSGSTLYGMTENGGNNGSGTIFKLENDGTGFSLLHSFYGGLADGKWPYGSLILSGSILFGMTCWGGDSDGGTIFKIETDGRGFTLLHEFAGSSADGAYPKGSLILSDTTLYGMTNCGGDSNIGTIFKIETDGSSFALLHKFNGGADDGKLPQKSLILSDSDLYGMTYRGGGSDFGTIFKIGTNGNGFTLLHEFTFGGDDGANPYGSLILSGSALYGMTPSGGDNSWGVIFSLPLESSTHTISGTITSGGSGLAGVLMSGLPGNPVTNDFGFYSTEVDHGWSGTVTPTRQYFTFSPSSSTYTNINSDQVTDYTATLSQSLIVTSPASGTSWEKGRAYAITWLKQGIQNANVRIALWKGAGTLVQVITTTTPNDGAYDWLVPATLAAGSDYFIRVRTVDNLISDFSDKFSVMVPVITVTAPTLGTVWVKNTAKTITWNKLGTQDANVKIQLYRGLTRVLDITLNAPNSGAYDWAIPATLANAVYTIRITTLDGKVKGISKGFTIARGMIRVTQPATGTRWQRGVAHTITWTGEGTLNANVKIFLLRGDHISAIAATTPNDGSFDWFIPANKMPANYWIRITTLDNLVSGQSSLFSITNTSI